MSWLLAFLERVRRRRCHGLIDFTGHRWSRPYQPQAIEGLPLTKPERVYLKGLLDQYDRERDGL
jgi:hypothetical protein